MTFCTAAILMAGIAVAQVFAAFVEIFAPAPLQYRVDPTPRSYFETRRLRLG
ncbi:hypothetical protein [Roseisolibacter sp. H3M3-2]|uniref:hypothetical protein n=1 Tax=Roseisolibacter sp. H3M3-2 TaxID=3031323 RepID=UPI0023D9D97B|nr:hypothetical protein [Roseisolibacter sp. H3M3-2]MDF1506550.1 hypothetical protein [Roseisolibacter sp. H3M3-2]